MKINFKTDHHNFDGEIEYTKDLARGITIDYNAEFKPLSVNIMGDSGIDSLRSCLGAHYGRQYFTEKVSNFMDRAVEIQNFLDTEKDTKKRVEAGIDMASELKGMIRDVRLWLSTENDPDTVVELAESYSELKKLMREVFIKSCGIDPDGL